MGRNSEVFGDNSIIWGEFRGIFLRIPRYSRIIQSDIMRHSEAFGTIQKYFVRIQRRLRKNSELFRDNSKVFGENFVILGGKGGC